METEMILNCKSLAEAFLFLLPGHSEGKWEVSHVNVIGVVGFTSPTWNCETYLGLWFCEVRFNG
jgi:hypothetical protein